MEKKCNNWNGKFSGWIYNRWDTAEEKINKLTILKKLSSMQLGQIYGPQKARLRNIKDRVWRSNIYSLVVPAGDDWRNYVEEAVFKETMADISQEVLKDTKTQI